MPNPSSSTHLRNGRVGPAVDADVLDHLRKGQAGPGEVCEEALLADEAALVHQAGGDYLPLDYRPGFLTPGDRMVREPRQRSRAQPLRKFRPDAVHAVDVLVYAVWVALNLVSKMERLGRRLALSRPGH